MKLASVTHFPYSDILKSDITKENRDEFPFSLTVTLFHLLLLLANFIILVAARLPLLQRLSEGKTTDRKSVANMLFIVFLLRGNVDFL